VTRPVALIVTIPAALGAGLGALMWVAESRNRGICSPGLAVFADQNACDNATLVSDLGALFFIGGVIVGGLSLIWLFSSPTQQPVAWQPSPGWYQQQPIPPPLPPMAPGYPAPERGQQQQPPRRTPPSGPS
jgi:hypothetical protein